MPTQKKSSFSVPRLFNPGNLKEVRRVSEILRRETTGGFLLLIAAVIAIVWANSPASESYFALRDTRVGFAALDLNLTLGMWASDGLLAVFFFLVGLELKREILVGELNQIRTAIVPVMAALGGVAVPALIFVAVNASHPELVGGWAIPTATDIAFAVAVLAIIGSHLPPALRMFLLTLAVVDDLVAISIIAFFYTSNLQLGWFALALIPIALYAFLAHRFRDFFETRKYAAWLILLPLGFAAWTLIHASGIHATIAGVLLGFMVPVKPSKRRNTKDVTSVGLAEQFEYRFRPLSAGLAVPIFAFFSAGVFIGGVDGFVSVFTNPLGLGILIALILGKPIGILSTTWLTTRFTRSSLDPSVRWIDLTGVGILGGIGFTVSLLVAELSFGLESLATDTAKVAIFTASLAASLLAAAVLGPRNRRYKRLERDEVTRQTS